MVTIAQALARGTSGATPVDETALSLRFEAELLLMNALGYNRASLLTWPEREIAPSALASFEQALNRRLAGEPIAYILGTKEFWDFELVVSPAVLIPRPETELLVESALEIVAHREGIQHLLDLGTGSGAVAIALARAAERIRVIGTDLSCDALASRERTVVVSLAIIWFCARLLALSRAVCCDRRVLEGGRRGPC